jgi:hypothetical protein
LGHVLFVRVSLFSFDQVVSLGGFSVYALVVVLRAVLLLLRRAVGVILLVSQAVSDLTLHFQEVVLLGS